MISRFSRSSLIVGMALLSPFSSGIAAEVGKTIKVGFAQTGAESSWRIANSDSMRSEATKRGIDLRFVDGNGKPEKQIEAVKSFIAMKVDAIVLAPIVVTGWDDVLRTAKAAGIPVVIMDRKVTADDALYAAFLGSDFSKEGTMVAQWLLANAGSRRKIVELQGTPGSSAANERRRAFATALAKQGGFKIIDSQVGNFNRKEGKQAFAGLLKKHGSEIEILYAHNDDMALGAAEAIVEAGLKPGKDILIVSIDGGKEAVQAVVDGTINCTVECNPLFGPKVYDIIERILKGERVPKETYNKDELFDATNAKGVLASRKY
jgi:galactofuranose transport system substrate-binding protein